jgi:hypothetical protein
MKNCPICGQEVESYHELTHKEPYVHTIPWDGLHIYGAYSSPKETLCFENNFLHFAFYDAEGNLVDHRLVQLGVENPTTKSPTDEFWEGYNERDANDFDESDDWEEADSYELQHGCGNDDDLPF